jgi:hypothetical protein
MVSPQVLLKHIIKFPQPSVYQHPIKTEAYFASADDDASY